MPVSFLGDDGELDRTMREAQVAKSEHYYDVHAGWGTVRAEGMWNLRWKARLRRQRPPNADLARLLTGPGRSSVLDAASGSGADVKAAAATVTATRGASGRIGTVLDDLVAQLVQSVHGVIEQRIDGLATQVKQAIGAPVTPRSNMNLPVAQTASSSLGFQGGNVGDGMSTAPRAD